MLKTIEAALVESLCETMETTAFIFTLPMEDKLPVPESSILARMKFSGPHSGTLELLAGTDTAAMIAANIMGVDQNEIDGPGKGIDALKELLNTTCGIFLPQIAATDDDVFDVTVPEAETFETAEQWNDFVGQKNVTVLDADAYPMAVRLIYVP